MELGGRIDKTLVGEESFYLLIDFSKAKTTTDFGLNLEILKEAPSVEKLFPASAFNLEVHNLDKLEIFKNGQSIPARKLHGLKSKKKDFQPDLDAPRIPGEIIIKYLEALPGEPPMDEISASVSTFKSRAGAKTKKVLGTEKGKLELIEFSTDLMSMEDALEELNASDEIEYAEPNYTVQLQTTPNDPNDPDFSTLWGMTKIQANYAWNTRTSTSSGVIVAVVDSGMQYTHHDLQANRWVNTDELTGNSGIDDDGNGYIDDIYGWDSIDGDGNPWDDLDVDPNDPDALKFHGTHVSGTIGAVGDNLIDVTGVAWSTKIMSLRIFDTDGSSSVTAIVGALEYARLNGATVINASWSISGNSPTLLTELEAIRDAGISFINSAGNNGTDHDQNKVYPSGYNLSNILSIAATDSSDAKASFSDYGEWSVDLAAPGVGILSTFNSNGTKSLSGTSMAAPHATGVYALAKSQFPGESNTEILDRLRFSVDKVAGLANQTLTGGRLNAKRALESRPTIFNISTRAKVKTGAEIVIAGFAITGTAPKRISLRARGPSMAGIVPGTISDTKIDLYSGSTIIASNDNWTTLPTADKNELISKGFQPSHNLESAWIGNLNPGLYTVHLKGPTGQTGIGIIEAYDIDGDNVERFVNLSTRCYVGTGSEVAIAGTWIAGDKPRRVLIRALGKTLGDAGVSNYLSNPKITLFKGATAVKSNDDWRDFDGTSKELEEKIKEFGLAPKYDTESIIVYDLDPGGYSIHLSGSGGATGVGIIEIFEFGSKKY